MQIAKAEIPFPIDPAREIFAIGDIHGYAGLLRKALTEIAEIKPAPGRARTIVFLGDLIDRGPDSLGTIDTARDACALARAETAVYLCGNHEQMLTFGLRTIPYDAESFGMELLKEKECTHALLVWFDNGGKEFLGEKDITNLPRILGPKRREFLDGLSPLFISGKVVFVHGGLPPHIPFKKIRQIPREVPLSTLIKDDHWAWVRRPFLRHNPGAAGHQGYFVCHGHTIPRHDPIPFPNDQIARARINLDGGSYATGKIRFARFIDHRIEIFEVSASA